MDTWRSNTIFTIQTMASPTAQVEFARETGLAPAVVGELVCMWGDDLYQPGLRSLFTHSPTENVQRCERLMPCFPHTPTAIGTPPRGRKSRVPLWLSSRRLASMSKQLTMRAL